MVKIKMIKSIPDFSKGKEYIMNNKEAAQMWVDEGVAEYVDKPKKQNKNVYIKIIKKTPINEVGDLVMMNSKGAEQYVLEGLAEYAEYPTPTATKEEKKISSIVNNIDDYGLNYEDAISRVGEIKVLCKQLDKKSPEYENLQLEKLKLEQIIDKKNAEIRRTRQERLKREAEIKEQEKLARINYFEEKKEKQKLAEEEKESLFQELSENIDELFKVEKYLILKKSDEKKTTFILIKDNKVHSTVDFNNLMITLQIKYFKHFDTKLPLTIGNNTIDYLQDIFLPLNLVEEVEGISYKPDIKENTFYFEGKKYFNEYIGSDIEKQVLNEDKIDTHNLDNLELKKNYDFKTIDKIFKHWVGDMRVFYSENIRLLENLDSNFRYKESFEKKKKHFFKKFGTIDKDELLNIFRSNLKEITTEEVATYDKNLDYLYKWFGYIFQNPTKKQPTGIAIKSTQGTFKDFAKDFILSQIFGSKNIKSLGQEILNEKFNGWMYGARIVIAQELEVSRKTIDLHQRIKDFMSNPYVSVRDLYKSPFTAPNYCNFLFFGNHDNMLRIEKNDRRFTIFEQEYMAPDTITLDISEEVIHLDNIPLEFKKELIEFARFLYNLKVSYSDIKAPLNTEIKDLMQSFSDNDIDRFIDFNIESFDNIEDMLIYYYKLEERNYLSQYLDKDLLTKEMTLKDPLCKENIPFEVLFYCFTIFKKNNNISGNRDSRSFSRELSSKGYTKISLFNKIEKKKSDYRFVKELFGFEEKKNLNIDNNRDETDLIEEINKLKNKIVILQRENSLLKADDIEKIKKDIEQQLRKELEIEKKQYIEKITTKVD